MQTYDGYSRSPYAAIAQIEAHKRALKWDRRFLELAALVASWSKDSSTQTGAAIVAPDRSVISMGYNGFPRGVADTPERLSDRDTKYSLVVHAEMNAVLSANRSVKGSTVYIHPFMPCERCAVHLAQAGVVRVVAPVTPADKLERWGAAFDKTKAIFAEVGIELVEIDL